MMKTTIPQKHPYRQQAFTLVELLLGVTLSAVILVGLATVLDATMYNESFNRETANVHQMARLISERISYDLRNAQDTELISDGIRIFAAADSPFTQIMYELTAQGDLQYRTRGGPSGDQDYIIIAAGDEVQCTDFSATITEDLVETQMVTVLASVRFTLQSGEITHTAVASGSPRGNFE